MKKLVVLAMLLVTVALWAQAPAVTLGAKVEYMWANDFGPGKEFSDKPVVELKWTVAVDEFNSLYVEIEEAPTSMDTNVSADAGVDTAAIFDRANFTTDLGKALKLPVPVTVKYGFDEWKSTKDGTKVTKGEYEDVLGTAMTKWGALVEIAASPMFTLRPGWIWNFGEKLAFVGAYGTVAPVTYEVSYFTNGKDMGDGLFEAGLKAVQDVSADLNVAADASIKYDLDALGTFASPDWTMGAALIATYQKMASLAVAFKDNTEATAGAMRVEVWAMPVKGKPLEVYGVLGFALDDAYGPETFDSVEATLKYSIGKSAWYVGMLWNADGGSFIAKEWADFTVAGSETTAIYMRGVVSF